MLLMENSKGKAKRKVYFDMPKGLYTCRYLSKLIVHILVLYNIYNIELSFLVGC